MNTQSRKAQPLEFVKTPGDLLYTIERLILHNYDNGGKNTDLIDRFIKESIDNDVIKWINTHVGKHDGPFSVMTPEHVLRALNHFPHAFIMRAVHQQLRDLGDDNAALVPDVQCQLFYRRLAQACICGHSLARDTNDKLELALADGQPMPPMGVLSKSEMEYLL